MNWKRWLLWFGLGLLAAYLLVAAGSFSSSDAHGKQKSECRFLRPGTPIPAKAGFIRQWDCVGGWKLVDRDYRKNVRSSRSGRQACGQWRSLVSTYFPASHVDHGVRCLCSESGGDANATHRNRNGTVDYGLWQINRGYQMYGAKIFDPIFNTQIARRMWGARGWSPWYGRDC